MRRNLISFLLVAKLSLCCSTTFAQNLSCKIGPVERQFGGTSWLVYACDDNNSVVIVTAPGNPAMPFYFIYSPKDGVYTLTGEGTGNRDATGAAFDELKELPIKEIKRLIMEANNA